ncbi:hypothetical protein MGMO_93c00030 [Methyloglobulus morosus KoM1]|uniref:Uncharacterized protein n=1 Tax=Methyloglobulus morosus KoM1 TaxID=1116472 RepID=V5BEE9_9GAMM|nr:hypothetical protein [Methyloglobulus morosus]ESS71645.1 hypothetical protein MGMO_93c00030 [Methyloglobulus morosus KoM1]
MAEINETVKLNPKIDFFKFDLRAEKQQEKFAEIFNKHNGNWFDIERELKGKEGFTPTVISNLKFTHNLAEWSNNDKALITVFQKDNHINSMWDMALNLTKTAFIEKVKAVAPAKTEDERKAFAINLHSQLFHLQPTAMLVNMVKDPEVPFFNDAVGVNIAKVLEKQKQDDFNIKIKSIYEILKKEDTLKDIPIESHEAVTTQLKNLQRVVAVSPIPDAVPALYNAGFLAAFHISEMPPAQFKAMMGNKGLDDDTIMQIHNHSQQVRARNQQTIMSLMEVERGTGIAMIDKGLGGFTK